MNWPTLPATLVAVANGSRHAGKVRTATYRRSEIGRGKASAGALQAEQIMFDEVTSE
ncbi:hypothetical protein [Rhodococcus sp. HNM0569]|uniref:hypothetical protein n=1 Tax=Rhodococcus sp. HNM0569 TaxID=2716340 RepID=UPI00146D6B2C|nr:hypothetical protein [Rhodococcus sp. HNM0569]NLU82693.1 hypothetical protein [Rhodococcus sp. HNM0569]